MKEIDPSTTYEIRVATLDATPDSPDQDLALTLGCIGPTQVAYLTPYANEILDFVDTLVFGIWDEAGGAYVEGHEHFNYSPILTDDGSSIYITNNAQLRQILSTFTYAVEGLRSGHYLISGMWESESEADGLWSEFDATGISTTLQYLGCFPEFLSREETPPLDSAKLKEYANRHAGGPGAIYVGDLRQLVGPAVTDEFMSAYGTILGDDNGQVPLYALEQHQWLYETDYYQSLLEKARLTNPTQLVSRGELISLQHICISTQLMWCQMFEAYFVPNVAARTNQQVHINVSSFPELGLAGPDTAQLIADGILDMAEIYGGYVGYNFPKLSLQYLWGLWPDHQTHFAVQTGIAPDLDRVVTGEMGAQVLVRNWIAGDDRYIFTNLRLNSPTDFRGLATRVHSTELYDWLDEMGAPGQFIAFSEVYTALERGILDAAVTSANGSLSQRWYEVTDYMNGPLTSFNSSIIAVNDQVWDRIPRDLQQILLEEGAKFELEALRLAAIQNITPLQRNLEAGMEYAEFSTEIRALGFESAVESVIPGLLNRLRYPDSGQATVQTFNDSVGPYVGLRIEADGSVITVPITAGPHAGKTMEQVLTE